MPFGTTISATSMPLSIAASATGGEVSIRAQKRPVATTSEAAIIENVRLVIIPSFVIGGLIRSRWSVLSPAFGPMCATAQGVRPHAGAPRAMEFGDTRLCSHHTMRPRPRSPSCAPASPVGDQRSKNYSLLTQAGVRAHARVRVSDQRACGVGLKWDDPDAQVERPA